MLYLGTVAEFECSFEAVTDAVYVLSELLIRRLFCDLLPTDISVGVAKMDQSHMDVQAVLSFQQDIK